MPIVWESGASKEIMTSPHNYEVFCTLGEPIAPLLVHAPHSSTVVPAHVRQALLLDDLIHEDTAALTTLGRNLFHRLAAVLIAWSLDPRDLLYSSRLGQIFKTLKNSLLAESLPTQGQESLLGV
jgi:hypothetical protein